MEQNLDEMFKVYLDEMFKVLAYAKATKEVFGEELFSKVFTEQIAKETEKESEKEESKPVFPKYKVGDKVIVRKDIGEMDDNTHSGITDDMRKMGGEILTISEVTDITVSGATKREGRETYTSYDVKENPFLWNPETFEGLAPEPKEKTWEPKYKVGDKVLFKVSKNGNYAGVVIHINHVSHIYTLGMLEDAPDTHNGVRATFAIDDICHVKKKFRHFVKDAECRWAYDFELEPYEEKTELKVGDRVCIEGVVDGVTGSGDFFILFDGEEKCGHTYISSSAEFKKVNK